MTMLLFVNPDFSPRGGVRYRIAGGCTDHIRGGTKISWEKMHCFSSFSLTQLRHFLAGSALSLLDHLHLLSLEIDVANRSGRHRICSFLVRCRSKNDAFYIRGRLVRLEGVKYMLQRVLWFILGRGHLHIGQTSGE